MFSFLIPNFTKSGMKAGLTTTISLAALQKEVTYFLKILKANLGSLIDPSKVSGRKWTKQIEMFFLLFINS